MGITYAGIKVENIFNKRRMNIRALVDFSFSRAAWECRFGALRRRSAARSEWIPTRRVGTSQ